MLKELVGWAASVLLIITFGSQTYMQWKGVRGKYTLVFFVSAILGTAGNLIYSWLVHNTVFIVLNAALVVNNSVGLGLALAHQKKKKEQEKKGKEGEGGKGGGEGEGG